MNNIEREVTHFMISTSHNSPGAVEAAGNIVQAVNQTSVQANLLQLIQSMGDYLTSEDEAIRAKATGLLSHTLRHCHHNDINNTAVSVLVDFYCERLTDRTCVPSLLDGLVALTAFESFSGVNAVTVATKLFERVDVQRFPQSTRNMVFQVLQNLVDRHKTSLKSINNEFVYGFTQAMDGEKDPRNLMSAFKLVKTIIDSFDISAHVEDLFEVTFCYFPITFKPPPDDPYGITAEDLKKTLRACVSATPLFAKFAVPLILEKLSSTSGSAKKDAMETMAACAPVYGPALILPVSEELFDSLKVEVLHSTDPAMEDSALQAIQSVVAALDQDQQRSPGETTTTALKALISECISHIKDPELKNAKPVGRILRAVASASDGACRSITDAVMPLLLRQYRETEVATQRKAIMDLILELLEASKYVYGSASSDTDLETHCASPLVDYKDRLFALFEPAVMASNEYNGLRLSALKGLQLMATTQGFVSQNELGVATQSFDKILKVETDNELRLASLKALKAVSAFNDKYVIEQTIPSLIALLPETQHEQSHIKYQLTLDVLKTLCPSPAIFSAAMPLLLQKLDHVTKQDMDGTYPCAILTSLLDILRTQRSEKQNDVGACIHSLVPHLITSTISASLEGSQPTAMLAPNVLEATARIIITVMETLDASAQKAFADCVWALYFSSDLAAFGIQESGPFQPFKVESSGNQKASTQLFAAVVTSCRKDVEFPTQSTEEFLNFLVDLAIKTDNEIQEISLARIVGSVINKWRQNDLLVAYVTKATSELQSIVLGENNAQSSKALDIYLWITKALVLRSHALGYALTDKVIEWCANPAIGKQASQGFDILIGDDPLALCKSSFATMTLLHKQRFFNHCMPLLVNAFQTPHEDIRHNYLIALSYLLKNVPKQILLTELPPLVPLLIQSLALPDKTLKVSTLETFCLALTDAPTVLTPHVRPLIPALLGLTETTAENPMAVRIAALKCLGQFPGGIPTDVLLPHVSYVTRELSKPLDDKKRLVRRAAVDCRAKWYSILA